MMMHTPTYRQIETTTVDGQYHVDLFISADDALYAEEILCGEGTDRPCPKGGVYIGWTAHFSNGSSIEFTIVSDGEDGGCLFAQVFDAMGADHPQLGTPVTFNALLRTFTFKIDEETYTVKFGKE